MRALAITLLLAGATARAAADAGDGKSVPPFVAVASVSASSFLANKKDPDRYAAKSALLSVQTGPDGGDDGPVTWSGMWCEGKPDEGIGETLTVTLAQPTRVDTLAIAAGVWKSEKLFARNNLPTRLAISVDGGAPQLVTVPATREPVSIALNKPVRSIAIKLAAVKKGAINDTCLSSLTLERDGTRMAPLLDLSPAAATALPDAIRRVVAAVGANDANGLAAVAAFPLSVETVDQCGNGGDVSLSKVTHADAKAMRKDCLAFRKQDLPSRSDPCPADAEPLFLEGGGDAVDVVLHSMCGGRLNPVFSLAWHGGAWKLSAIGTRAPDASP